MRAPGFYPNLVKVSSDVKYIAPTWGRQVSLVGVFACIRQAGYPYRVCDGCVRVGVGGWCFLYKKYSSIVNKHPHNKHM